MRANLGNDSGTVNGIPSENQGDAPFPLNCAAPIGTLRAPLRIAAIMSLVLASLALMAQIPVSYLPSVALFGKDYVRVEDWARANHFQLTWLVKNQELQASNGSAKIDFSVNSAKISINGVNAWVSAPIALKDGGLLIAPIDLTKTIQPLVAPETKSRHGAIRTICLDPG